MSHLKRGEKDPLFLKLSNGCSVGNDESATIKQLKSNIKILFENQKLHSTKMQEALNFNNLTRIETRNNRKLNKTSWHWYR